MTAQVDVIVLGLGPGGEQVAGELAGAGLSVLGVEGGLVGGECPYWGCIPSKMIIRSANLLAEARRVPGMAGSSQVFADWSPVGTRIRDEATANWNDQAAVDRFVGKGGVLERGWGRLDGPGRINVDGKSWQARLGVVVSTGMTAVIPPIEGLAGTPYWTNREAIEADTLPQSLLILGGGAIGLELAQAFARFGVAVVVIEAADRLLATEEPEASTSAEQALTGDGVRVMKGMTARRVAHAGDTFTITMSDEQTVTGQRLLVATGRRADLTRLGLDSVGLDPSARAVKVDEHMRAGEKLWAVGDVTGRGAFTHVATYQAGIAIRDILGRPGPPADYRALPRVTFTDPEIGAVGRTEAQARAHGVPVRVGLARTADSTRGWIHKAGDDGFIKLVADAERGVLVGATSAGPAGGEVLGALAVAVHGEVPVERLQNMIYAYPTFHRGIQDALRTLESGA